MRSLSVISVIALVATIFAAGPGRVYACSCAGPGIDDASNQHLLDRADAVAVGVVQDVKPGADGYGIAQVRTERGYKGDIGDNFQVRIDQDSSCGVAIRKHERYVLVMEYVDAQLSTNLCGVAPSSDSDRSAASVVASLDRIAPNPTVFPSQTSSLRTPTIVFGALAIALIAATAASTVIYRRYRQHPDG